MPPHPGCFGGTDFDVTFVASRSHQARGAMATSLKHDAMTQTPVAVLLFIASPDKREANFLGTEARVSPRDFSSATSVRIFPNQACVEPSLRLQR